MNRLSVLYYYLLTLSAMSVLFALTKYITQPIKSLKIFVLIIPLLIIHKIVNHKINKNKK